MAGSMALAALERLPVLPMSSVVLVPGMVLPLNVSGPAERDLVDFIREHDQHLGVPLLRAQERGANGKPAFEAVFGLGRMLLHTPLADGRRVIRLEGVGRVRLLHEHPSRRSFREVAAAPLPDPQPPDPQGLAVLRAQLERIAAHGGAYELALTTALAIPEAPAFLDAVTICLPCLELLGRKGRVVIDDFTDRTTHLQQQSLAAESADQRVALLCARASAALARFRDRSPPRLTN
ncbi:MAG: LON peptidase substrate-binding domain-containing protein [Nannocystis sp.]|nr:LON peptidase substrate-binding domain-containing protein [Nannocystis sp.]MBA3546376.1 LON peptidase substrate-binding domain-containing protein [Nannocystis sp.]